MNPVLFDYIGDVVILILLCLLCLLAIKKGLEFVLQIEELADRLKKKVRKA
jgi:hypothetical protein